MKQNIPTLQQAINHVQKNGGHFKGRKGRVQWIAPENSQEQKGAQELIDSAIL